MKKYKINVSHRVNSKASGSGVKWEYRGKTDDWKEKVETIQKGLGSQKEGTGIRVTDTETGEIVYEETHF